MCNMRTIEDINHFLLECPYLDSARVYALLLWKAQLSNTIYNLFSSAILHWPICKIILLLLDPISQFHPKEIGPHPNLDIDMLRFVQDYIFSLHRQCQVLYGEWRGPR